MTLKRLLIIPAAILLDVAFLITGALIFESAGEDKTEYAENTFNEQCITIPQEKSLHDVVVRNYNRCVQWEVPKED